MNDSIGLTKLWFKNFKSIKDLEITPNGFSLLVGPNASGKSNIIQAIKLFRNIITKDYEGNPFFEWWGYNNVVWKKDERLPIVMGMELNIYGYICKYESTITGMGGNFNIINEKLYIKDICKIKKGNSIEVERYISNIDIKNRKQRELFGFIKRLPPKYMVNLSTEVTLLQPSSISVFGAKDMNAHIIILNYEKESEIPSNVVKIPSNALLLILPVLSKDIEKQSITLLDFVINFLKEMEIVSLTSNIKTKKNQ